MPPTDRRALLQAVGLYVALRAVSLAVIAVVAAQHDRSLWTYLGSWDAGWYADIATHGYDDAVPVRDDGSLATTNLAFFPLFPGLVALVSAITPLSAGAAAIVLAWVFGAVAAAGIHAVGSHLRDSSTGLLLVGLWALLPHALVESMGYTETLFTALCAWSLWFLLRRRWVAAGLLCLLAGLTRPTGAALVAAVGAAALVAVVRRRDGWRPWVGGALAPLGLLGYVAWVGLRLGRADGYFHVQRDAWGMSYDLGGTTLGKAASVATEPSPLTLNVVTLVLLIALVLLVLLALDRLTWPVVLFAAVVVALSFFGAGYYHAKARLILPAFPLLVPVAIGLAGARLRTRIAALAVLGGVSTAYGAYLCVVWTGSP